MQKIRYSRYFKYIFILLDITILAVVFLFFFYKNNDFTWSRDLWQQNLLSLILLTLFWILLSGRTRLYSIPRNLTYTLYLERLISHVVIFIFGVILLANVSNNDFLKINKIYIASSLFLILSGMKSIFFFIFKYIRSRGFNHRNIMFLHENTSSDLLKSILIDRTDYGFKIFEFHPRKEINIKELVDFWKLNGIHTLFLPSENAFDLDIENQIFSAAEENKVKISLLPNIIQNNFFRYDLGYIETQPILSQTKYPLDFHSNYLLKKIFDLVFAVLVLIFICSWLFPIIALLIRLDSKGPIFFIQKRYGFHDEVFNCIKFRTMVVNEESSTKTTLAHDSRITKIGAILRKTSLDEMPQFINVILGDMSVLGPRPHMLLVDDYYKNKINRYSLRSLVKPGISGLAQVNGLRGDNGHINLEMEKRILADSFYVKNWSLVLDFVILLKTIFLIITGDKKAH